MDETKSTIKVEHVEENGSNKSQIYSDHGFKIKTEDNLIVKTELIERVSARQNMYMDHQIKEDIVIGPTELQQAVTVQPVKNELIEEVCFRQNQYVDHIFKEGKAIGPTHLQLQETNESGRNGSQEKLKKSRLQKTLLKEGRTKSKKCRCKTRNELLEVHMEDCNKTKMAVTKSKTYNVKFKCRICNRNFGYNDARFMAHINSHRELGIMYLCSCGEKFSEKEKYKIHSCVNEKKSCTEHKGKYYCDTCNKVYVNLFVYSLHTCKEPETKIN